MIEFLILMILLDERSSIYEIKQKIEKDFSIFLNISFGSIHPALKRLEDKNYVTARKSISKGGQRKSSYSITQTGKEYFNSLMLEELPNNPSIADQLINIKLISLSKLPSESLNVVKSRIIEYLEDKINKIRQYLAGEYNNPDKNTINFLNYTLQKAQKDIEYVKSLEIIR